MSRRKTKEELNAQLEERGITLVGDFTKVKDKSLFECDAGHQWSAIVDNVIRRSGCPECSGCQLLSSDAINNRLQEQGRMIRMIGIYTNNKTKTLFRCENGHEWLAEPKKVVNVGRGCPHCAGLFPLSKEIVNGRLKERGITLVSDYQNVSEKGYFLCSEGHEWHAKISHILSGIGCPSCSTCGFDISKPAHTYVLLFDGFIKFGITNNLGQRLKNHRKNGVFTVIETRHYEIGSDALEWERAIKRTHGGRFVTKDRCPDGYTETLPTHLLAELLQKT